MKNALLVLSMLFVFSATTFAQNASASIENASHKKTTTTKKSTEISKAVFMEATQMASTQLATFIKEEVQYPESLQGQGLEGTIIVDVWISPKGTITKTKIVKSFNDNFNDYVLRAFDNLSFLDLETSAYFGASRIRLPMNFSFE